jgi:hypothetical protein
MLSAKDQQLMECTKQQNAMKDSYIQMLERQIENKDNQIHGYVS